ncbi:hypothetical protein BCR44DRAFT_209769 [Catenaria anguillulae PL171]|uniref:Uncharacterized protein n=1 Tax=Catenaria anguillulae PL171 TaxID=765915 RepID=A0A1Y2H3P0_9FUNG|nr:hypothetical protein BCR44DRAFT_209769 [Catenaria anguillulae PL171]
MRFALAGLVSLDAHFVAHHLTGWHTTHVPVWVWRSFCPTLLASLHLEGSIDMVKAAAKTVNVQEMRSCAMDSRTEQLAAFADWLPDVIHESAGFLAACTRRAAASGLDKCKWHWLAAERRVR